MAYPKTEPIRCIFTITIDTNGSMLENRFATTSATKWTLAWGKIGLADEVATGGKFVKWGERICRRTISCKQYWQG